MKWRKTLMLAGVIAFSAGASAEIFHDLDASRNEAVLNTTIELESDSPINRWSLTWSVPEESEVVRVRDSAGSSDYDRTGDSLEITTNSGPARQKETVRVVSQLNTEADGIHKGLWERKLPLPGLKGENTSGTVEAENLISWKTGYGFRSARKGNGFSFRGTGPVTLSFKAGNGNTTQHFQFFGRETKGAEDAFRVAAGTTGLRPRFERFPVATLPGAKYNRTVNEWSQGEYVNGRVRIRQGLEEDFVPVLAHEVVHGLNDRKLTWDRTRSTYFDEGMASHIENLLRRAKQSESSEPPAGELFGDTSTYDPDTGDQSFLRVPPRGEADRLWEYYENNLSFMKRWSAQDSRNRRFGYAYSELVVKKHVADGGSLKELYENLDPGREITDPSAKWEFFSEHVDMKPCKLSSREEFNACLDRVRSHEYGFSRAVPEPGDGSLKVEEVQLPDRTEQRTYVERGPRNTNRSQGSSAAVSALGDLFNRLFSWV